MKNTSDQIVVYSTTWCGYCKMLKKYLTDKGLTYVEKDIETDAAAHAELMEKIGDNFRGVPVADIYGNIILGFDRPAIDEALAK